MSVYCPGSEYCDNLGWVDPDNNGYMGSANHQDYMLVPQGSYMSCLSQPNDAIFNYGQYGANFS